MSTGPAVLETYARTSTWGPQGGLLEGLVGVMVGVRVDMVEMAEVEAHRIREVLVVSMTYSGPWARKMIITTFLGVRMNPSPIGPRTCVLFQSLPYLRVHRRREVSISK